MPDPPGFRHLYRIPDAGRAGGFAGMNHTRDLRFVNNLKGPPEL